MHERLLDHIEAAMQRGPYIAGGGYSLADAAATPYIWRLTKLRLSADADGEPGVARWCGTARRDRRFPTKVGEAGLEAQAIEDVLAGPAGFRPASWR